MSDIAIENQESIQPPLPSYDGDLPYLYVSFADADRPTVYRELSALGCNVAYEDVSRIGGCALFVVFVRTETFEVERCRAEIAQALTKREPMLAVCLAPVELPAAWDLANVQSLPRFALTEVEYWTKLEKAVAGVIAPSVTDGQRQGLRTQRLLVLAVVLIVASVVALIWNIP